jgi:ribokinase
MNEPECPAPRVLVVGTLNVDLVWQVPSLPRPGQTIVAEKVERQFGGKGANQAVAAARQGARVTLVGAVGDDAEGRAYREHLQREGLNVGAITTIPGVATGTAHVYVDARGENLIVVDRGANARLDLAPLAELLIETDALVVQLECALPAAVEALRLAAATGVRSILNASPTQPDFPWGRHAIDTVIVNEHECVDCFQQSPAELAALSDPARQEFLRERRMSHLVITQGADVTLLLATTAVRRVPTYPVTPRDTVGAGDTFAGALAAQLAAGFVWERALQHANIAAALSTLALGAQAAMPTLAAVEAAKRVES